MDYDNYKKMSRKALLKSFEKERQEWLAAGMSEADIDLIHFGEEKKKGHGGDYGVWLKERTYVRPDHKYAPGTPVSIDAIDPNGTWISGGYGGLDDVESSIYVESVLSKLTSAQRELLAAMIFSGATPAEYARDNHICKGDSIENQQAIIAAYCDERPGLVIREIYTDNGLSGQKLERPAFQKMLADMENGVIDCCVSKDLSRYGRSAIDTGFYIEKYFPAHGIRCIAINDDYDSADPRSGGLSVSLKNLVNESYALEIGRKIHATKQMNIRNGCFVGSLPPYGYLKSKADSHKLISDPVASPIVAEMFAMAANGDGVPAIRDWLNGNNILPPMKHFHSIGVASEKRASGHHHWNVNAIYTILKNRVYVGDMVQGKGITQSYDMKSVDKADWIITENTHEGIVSRELFAKVQKLWGKQPGRAKPDTTDNVFLRKIFCGHCGFALCRSKSGRTGFIYKCETRQRYGKGDCVPNSISEATLKNIVLGSLRKKAEVYCQDMELVPKAETVKEPSELSGVRAELSRVSGFLAGLYESLVNGDLTQREYADMKQDYETRVAALTERERVLTEAARERQMNQIAADKAGASLRAVNLTAESVNTLIDKILIFEDKRIEIHYKFTDEISMEGGADND